VLKTTVLKRLRSTATSHHAGRRQGALEPGQRRGNHDSTKFQLRTLAYSLRRALSLDSVDGGTHNPTTTPRRQPAKWSVPLVHAWCSERNCTSAAHEMRRMKYLLRLSLRVGLRSPPRLSTPAWPSKTRITCFVLIFSLLETSAGVKYSASSGRPAGEVDSVRPGTSLCVAGVAVCGCWRLRILAWARSSRVAFNQSRFLRLVRPRSNDQVQCTIGTLNNRRCQLMDVALPGCAA